MHGALSLSHAPSHALALALSRSVACGWLAQRHWALAERAPGDGEISRSLSLSPESPLKGRALLPSPPQLLAVRGRGRVVAQNHTPYRRAWSLNATRRARPNPKIPNLSMHTCPTHHKMPLSRERHKW